MTIPVPTLSVAGWVTAPGDKADMLMAHFFESVKSQSALYKNNVANLQWVIEETGTNPIALCEKLRSELTRYLSRYYSTVDLTITNDALTSAPSGMLNITMSCIVVDDGISYSFGRLLQFSGTKLAKVVDLNNMGVTT